MRRISGGAAASEPWQPRDYQVAAVELLLKHPAAGLFADPGLGKTSCMLRAFGAMKDRYPNWRALVIAPRHVAHNVWPAEVRKWQEFAHLRVAVLHGPRKEEALRADADLYVVNPEGLPWLLKRAEALRWRWPEVLVVDECFVAGTSIETPLGPQPIETLRIGDEVLTPAGPRAISQVFEGRTEILVRVELEDGRIIETTPSHPFATTEGWKSAQDLHGATLLRHVREANLAADDVASAVLQSFVFAEKSLGVDDGRAALRDRPKDVQRGQGADALERRDTNARRDAEEAERDASSDALGADDSAGKRNGAYESRGAGARSAGRSVGMERLGEGMAEHEGLPDSLQARSGMAGEARWNRDRWIFAQSNFAPGAGSEERALAEKVRVARVSLYKLRDSIPVFNLEVEGCPLYEVAGGVVVHNSTKFKHPNTLRFRTLHRILDTFKRRYILTGKPVPNGLLDLFGQLFILDGGKRLGKFITHFRNKYFYQTGYGGYTWKPLSGADAQILGVISDITMRLDKREHLKDLPPYLDNVVKVSLGPSVMDEIAKLERTFVLELAGGTVEAFNAAALTAKLRQMSSGAVYAGSVDEVTRTGRTWAHVHDAKLDALDALLAEREGSPTLVAYQFVHSAERIAKAFPEARVLSWETDSGAAKLLDAWNRGEVPLLLVHPASAAHGLNLQGGSEALVWFDPTYDLEHYDQLIARLWRQGQKLTVVNHLLVAAGTIDEAVIAALRGKDREQSAFLAALRAHYATP